uniref:Reticulon-like protein n=1 Tax=Kalanchoe fedtschenkoi TaxID=63787 RepID=A0A7N0U2B2_KALFE
MPIYSSDSDGYGAPPQKFFSRQKSLYSVLGRGKVADILLWRRKNLSAGILFGFTFIWFLFQVLDYTFITLLCHSVIILMIGLFVWSNGAGFINIPPPRLRDIGLSESTFRTFFMRIRWFAEMFYDIARGRDMRLFFVIILSLWIFSVLGNHFSTLNLLYIGFLCIETIPALYERYKNEVDYLASKGSRDAKKLFRKIDSTVLKKIPRGPVKEKRRY